jgi:uncharacterized integral membrane protein
VSFVKLLLGIVVMAVILMFAFLNNKEEVTIRYWLGETDLYRNVPLMFAMSAAYLFGILTYFFISLVRDIRLRTQIGRLRRENKTLQAELRQLRGSALDDLPAAETAGKENEGEVQR